MAELADYRADDLVAELESLEKLRLLDSAETKIIAKNRKDFDHKRQRRTLCKDDFLKYIRHEINVLQLIGTRREKMGVFIKKSEIEYPIANRVNTIFKEACFKFQEDVKLWVSYIKFCKRMRLNASHILDKMLQVHGAERPELWKFAANLQLEIDVEQPIENTRKYLLKGLRFHPESSVLFSEAFRLELMFAARLRKKRNMGESSVAENGAERNSGASTSMLDVGGPLVPEEALGVMAPLGNIGIAGETAVDQVMDGKLAMMMYESSLKKVKDVEFFIGLLCIAKEYTFTRHLQEKIIHDLWKFFPDEELTWDTMARLELEGLSYAHLISNQFNQASDNNAIPSVGQSILIALAREVPILKQMSGTQRSKEVKKKRKLSLKERIRFCCAVYNVAVKHLDTERMWSLYIECLLELLGNGPGGAGRLKDRESAESSTVKTSTTFQHNPFPCFTKKLVLQAFTAAHNARKMTERYYLMWVDMLQGDNTPTAMLDALSASGKLKKGTKGIKGKGKAGKEGVRNSGVEVKKEKKGKKAVTQHKKVARILAAATERLPQSPELWMTRLRHEIFHSSGIGSTACKKQVAKEKGGTEMDVAGGSKQSTSGQQVQIQTVESVFAQASDQLGDAAHAVPIWKVMLHYTQAKGDLEKVEKLYQDSLKRGPAIALAFKPMYIEWIVLTKGIVAARKVYDQISVQPPLCLEIHTKMAHLEGLQPNVNLKNARKCFELARDQFGKSNTDVWMEYVKFEICKGCPENITNIYWQALETLDSLQKDIFISEFSLLKTGMGTALVPSGGSGVNTHPNDGMTEGSNPMVLG